MKAQWPVMLAALALAASACGDSGTTTTTTNAPPATAPPTTVPPTTAAPGTTPPTTTQPPAAPEPTAWVELATSGTAPAARRNAVLAIDPAADAAYLQGGRAGGDSLADLWRLDLATGAWTELAVGGDRPAARFSHTAVWDERRSRLVVFSGEGQGFGDFFSDVWAYDPSTDSWTMVAGDGAGPSDRYGSCAGYDAVADRFIITHGFTNDGRFDDTWAFDLGSDTWTEIAPGGTIPGARCLHACTYDPIAGGLVMFGGQDDDVPFLDETWVLDASGWTHAAAGPSARKFPSTSPAAGGVVLFGGDSADGETDDTWRFASGAWEQLAPEGMPGARESHAAATHPVTGEVWVVGGRGPDGELADVWVFSPRA